MKRIYDLIPTGNFVSNGVYNLTGIQYFAICSPYVSLYSELPETDEEWFVWADSIEDWLRPKARAEIQTILQGVLSFLATHPALYAGVSYQRDEIFLLSACPPKVERDKIHGDGFEGHGTACVLDFRETNPPDAILILGPDD